MKIPNIIKQAAHSLRINMTDSEKILWQRLRLNKLQWKRCVRQKPVHVFTEDGWFSRYIIADFLYLQEKIILEIDGSVHSLPEVLLLDKEKEELLKNLWYTVLRFTNKEVSADLKSVIETIEASLLSYERGEFKRRLWKTSSVLSKKRFTMLNETFICENCNFEVSKHPSGSARNHCPNCLYSKHLDAEFPGDRASDCHGLMRVIWLDHRKNKGLMLVHECSTCWKKMLNRVAEDDNQEILRVL